jgi:hypothetical protein
VLNTHNQRQFSTVSGKPMTTHETVILMKNILSILLIISLTSCSTETQKNEIVNSDNSSERQTIENFPKVDFKISLSDTILNFGDIILLNLSLTNNSNEEQKLLFDKPRVSTGGPWATTGKVTDTNKKLSVVEYENKAMLSSKVYTEEELKDNYYYLKPRQTLNRQYELTDIVVLNSPNKKLPKGNYEIQLFYYNNISNILSIKIK